MYMDTLFSQFSHFAVVFHFRFAFSLALCLNCWAKVFAYFAAWSHIKVLYFCCCPFHVSFRFVSLRYVIVSLCFSQYFCIKFSCSIAGPERAKKIKTHTHSYIYIYMMPHFVFMARSAIFIRRCNQANRNNNSNNNKMKNNRRITKMFIYIGAKGISMLLFALCSLRSFVTFGFLFSFIFLFACATCLMEIISA